MFSIITLYDQCFFTRSTDGYNERVAVTSTPPIKKEVMKMFKRKLFKHAFSKRALPVILSVAMIFQSMPATAMAAENAVAVEESVEDTTDEQTATEAAEPASEQGDSEAEPSEAEPAEDSETSVSAEESKEDSETPTSTEETTEDSKIPASTEESKEDSETPASTEESKEDNESSVSTEEPSQDATVSETTEVAEESTTTEEEMQEAGEDTAAKLETVIKVAEPSLGRDFTLTQYEEDSYLFTSDYASTSKFENVKSSVKSAITIEVNGEEKASLIDDVYLKLQYQAGTEKDGNIEYTDMAGLPTDAGKYRLKLSVDAVPELCGKAADKFVYFEIKKAELKLNINKLTDIKPGTAFSDFKKNIIDQYSVKENDNDDRTNLTQLAAEDITIYEVDKEGNRAETKDTVFSKDKDYIVTIQVKFKNLFKIY